MASVKKASKDLGLLFLLLPPETSGEPGKRASKNLEDKGFRNAIDAAQAGQTVLQPIFSKGDKQFNRNEVLHTAAVAVIRSGNERAVGRCKMSWFVKRGCSEAIWDVPMLCDVWEAWTFQVNFMYDKYL